MINEIKRLQKLAGISEIKVSPPIPTEEMWGKLQNSIIDLIEIFWGKGNEFGEALDRSYFEILGDITKGGGFEFHKLSNGQKSEVYRKVKKLYDENR